MKSFLICIKILLLLSINITAQNKITFHVDMLTLIESELFQPKLYDSLVVRGSFNGWSGSKQALSDSDNDGIYSLNTDIGGFVGDTIQYKFVIIKTQGFDSWEVNPNPQNPNYGNRTIVLTGKPRSLPIVKFDIDKYIIYPITFNKEELQEDFLQMRESLETIHPALYEFTDKETFDLLFEKQFTLIDTNLSVEEFHRIIEPLIAAVGCGHTGLWMPNKYWHITPQMYFPLKLRFIRDKVYTIGQFGDSLQIPIGSEIISINNKPIQEVTTTLMANHRADGFNSAFKSASVEKKFSKLFPLQFGFPEKFIVQFINPEISGMLTRELSPVSVSAINREPIRGDLLEIELIDDISTAILTINTFIYYDQLEMFKSFIDSAFTQVKKKNIQNLIIDLRGNDGGDPFCSTYLLSYIEKEPVPYFSEPHGSYSPLADPIPLAENSFKENVYTLIDGNGFSTTGHFCSVLKYNKICTFVGSELGSTYTCNGSTRDIVLKNTTIILCIAHRHSYSVAVDGMDKTRGIIPDYAIEPTVNDLIEGNDVVKEFTLELINANYQFK